jgi:hypothetical protein
MEVEKPKKGREVTPGCLLSPSLGSLLESLTTAEEGHKSGYPAISVRYQSGCSYSLPAEQG